MKTKMQIVGAITFVLVVALGARNVAFAEKSSAASGPRLGSLISQLFRAGSPDVQAQIQGPQAAGSVRSVGDNPHPEDLTPEAEHAPEAVNSAEPGDDNGGQGEMETHAEITGTLSAIDAVTVTIDGQIFNLAANAEGASSVKIGDTVKLEFITNPDGTVVVREVKLADASGNSNDPNQSTDDTSVRQESGDDSGGHGGRGGGSGTGGGGSDDGSGG